MLPQNLIKSCMLLSLFSYYLFVANKSSDLPFRKKKPRRLVSLCIGVLGQHLEDIIADISEIAAEFPPDIKVSF